MKVKIKDLVRDMKIEIQGSEDWLQSIYRSFPTPPRAPQPMLTGNLLLHAEYDGERIQITGELNYMPFVDCSRCGDLIPWSISAGIDVQFQPAAASDEEQNERWLTERELDEYFIEEGCIDIESFVNEQIQMSIPLKTVKLKPDGESCGICGEDMSSDEVYRDPDDETSPFASLKGLKLTQNDRDNNI